VSCEQLPLKSTILISVFLCVISGAENSTCDKTDEAPLKTLFVILFLNVLLFGHLPDEPRDYAARSKRYGKGRELIYCAGNYQTPAPIESSQSKSDNFLVRLLAARDLFSLALQGLFGIGA